jgi:hypothetical protein
VADQTSLPQPAHSILNKSACYFLILLIILVRPTQSIPNIFGRRKLFENTEIGGYNIINLLTNKQHVRHKTKEN